MNIRRAELPNTYMRAFNLAAIALKLHARRHFPDYCPKFFLFWKDVDVTWDDLDFSFDPGDMLPIAGHMERPIVRMTGLLRIGSREPTQADVRVEFVKTPDRSLPTEQVSINIFELGKDGRRHYYKCGEDIPVSIRRRSTEVVYHELLTQ